MTVTCKSCGICCVLYLMAVHMLWRSVRSCSGRCLAISCKKPPPPQVSQNSLYGHTPFSVDCSMYCFQMSCLLLLHPLRGSAGMIPFQICSSTSTKWYVAWNGVDQTTTTSGDSCGGVWRTFHPSLSLAPGSSSPSYCSSSSQSQPHVHITTICRSLQ